MIRGVILRRDKMTERMTMMDGCASGGLLSDTASGADKDNQGKRAAGGATKEAT